VTPAVMAVFFWKRTTTAGAICSITLGTVITVAWNLANVQVMDAVYPALAISLLSLVVVSLLTPPPAEEKWRPFFDDGKNVCNSH
jgi:Na+/proline symporter